MSKLPACLLSTAYFPPVSYFAALANAETAVIERCETYQKQSYRTRCHIYSANGLLVLTLPVLRTVPAVPEAGLAAQAPTHKADIREIRVDYTKPWLQQHKRALEAAYCSSPFFEYYRDDLFAVLDRREEFLLELNTALTELLAELIGLSVRVAGTDSYRETAPPGTADLRRLIHPKRKGSAPLQVWGMEKPYYQVFSGKQGFLPDLSVLDLLFNEGPESISYLKMPDASRLLRLSEPESER